MSRPRGLPKTGGKKKGSTNKTALSVKEAVWNAFLELQKDDNANIIAWGKKNPRDFYVIAAKLIPAEISGVGGKDLIPTPSLNQYSTDELIKRAEAIKKISNDKG